jgi:hypothetical protein
MLARDPKTTFAIASDTEADSDAVILAVAIRDKAACELEIPKDKYDGMALLELIERHTGTHATC